MDLEVIIGEDGVPLVKVPALLDWLDVQIDALETAREGLSPEAATYIDNVIDSYAELKAELTDTTMEAMDDGSEDAPDAQ